METYAIAAEQSNLTVSIRRVLSGRGTFARLAGTVTVDENAVPQSLAVSIDARSLQTGISVRDGHLKTAAFLDAGRYPLITYASDRIERVGADRYAISGVLRLHGHEHPVTLEARLEPADLTPGAARLPLSRGERGSGGEVARRVRFSGTVSRSAFAIPPSPRLRTMVWAMFGDAVTVTGSVCLVPAREGMTAEAPSLRGSLSQG